MRINPLVNSKSALSLVVKKRLVSIVVVLLLCVITSLSFYNFDSIKYYNRSVLSKIYTSPDILELDIKFDDLLTLDGDRLEAEKQKSRIPGENQWVPGKIKFENIKVKIKLRLTGAYSDHRTEDKWSLKIKVKDGETIKGLKEFSLLVPKSRRFAVEPLFHNVLKNEGLIYHRMEFVVIKINGESLGVYLFVENANTQLVENNKRREGPLLQFDTSRYSQLLNQAGRTPNSKIFKESFIRPANNAEFKSKTELKNSYNHAIGVLELFKEGRISVSEAFDITSIAKVAALYALFNSSEFDWKDIVFYYNTIISKFEVIGKEIDQVENFYKIGWWYGGRTNSTQREFNSILFRDPVFTKTYISYLEHYTSKPFLEETFEKFQANLDEYIHIIRRDVPKYSSPWGLMKRNATIIQSFIKGESRIVSYLHSKTENYIDLTIYSRHYFEVIPLFITDQNGNMISKLATRIPIEIFDGNSPAVRTIRFDIDNPVKDEELRFHYSVRGVNKELSIPIRNWIPLVDRESNAPEDVESLTDYFDVDENAKLINCREGTTNIERSVVIPKNFNFTCAGNVILRLGDNVSFTSYSAVKFIGKDDKKIKIIGSQNSFGFIVIQASSTSVIQNTTFENLGIQDKPGRLTSGAVTFYESDVEITNSEFLSNNSGDDNLNVVRSQILIDNVTIKNSLYDGIDLDFVNGKIHNLNINQSGNDGLDLSGSELTIDGINIVGAGDKGISFGERSYTTVSNAIIKNASTGIAVKDESVITAKNVQFSDLEIGFSAYKKKSEFDGGELIIENAIWNDTVKMISNKDNYSSITWIN